MYASQRSNKTENLRFQQGNEHRAQGGLPSRAISPVTAYQSDDFGASGQGFLEQ